MNRSGTATGPSSADGGDLPERAREAAYRAYRGWRIGDDGEGRLHAALVAYAAAGREQAEEPHRPGPRRMVSRDLAPADCLSCGQRWPCEGSWRRRAEQAEAQRDRIRESSARALTRVAAGIAEQRDRAEAAEAKLAAVRSVLLEGGQPDATARRRALGIIGGGEEADHA